MNPSLALLIISTHPALPLDGSGHLDVNRQYAYGSPEFSRFVDQSFASPEGSKKFYNWVDLSIKKVGFQYPSKKAMLLNRFLDDQKADLLRPATPEIEAKKQRKTAIWVHRMVKKILPHFNLETGFEFKNSVNLGQRQCFLQSVFIAGCLQRAGMNAGVTMVNRNIVGQETNNKHAICLLKLSNGKDVIVDASEDYAFAKQQGLFVDSPAGYRFVKPVYDGDFSIRAYEAYNGQANISVASIRPLPRSFIVSQFDYYRGERTEGGVMAKRKTDSGLIEAAGFLAKSVAEDPDNSLAQYMLGRVFLYRNSKDAAARSLDRAMRLYDRQGWIPPDERMAQAKAHKYS